MTDADWFCMTHGGGGSSFRPLVSIDVAGHEMTHGVTSNTAGLRCSGESRGLNEAISDIFGTIIEFAAANASDPGDYDIGEETDKSNGSLRRMDDPDSDGSSANCWSRRVGRLNVNYFSGVGNHVFYLLAEGTGSKTLGGLPRLSTTCNGTTLTGIGQDAAAKIWYRGLTVYVTSTTRYQGARDAIIRAGRDLYGPASSECSAVVRAWNGASVPAGAATR